MLTHIHKLTHALTLRMKELELEDRQYEVDKELNELLAIPGKLLLQCM